MPITKKKRKPAKLKFRNPLNYDEVSSGQGIKPNWMRDGIAAGLFTEEQCLIVNQVEHPSIRTLK